MPENNIAFAKIVANPTAYSWSQAYNAGRLFAVISLEKNEEGAEENDTLKALGKEILDSLENEYFSLETKDLESIKNAVLVTSKKIPEDVFCSFVICAIVNNILYGFVLGKGRIDLEREEKLGTILEVKESPSSGAKAVSGFLQKDDTIVLQTQQFAELISTDDLASSLDHQPPSEIAETLAPKIHGHDKQSGASAIIITYKTPEEQNKETVEPVLETEIEKEETSPVEKIEDLPRAPVEVSSSRSLPKITNFIPLILGKIKIPKIQGVNHSKKLYLTVAVIIAVIFVVSAFLAVKKQNDAKTAALFNRIYPSAQKKYDEGESLLSLNQNAAYQSFIASKDILENGKAKFPAKSTQEQQIIALLQKVNQAISASSGVTSANAQSVDSSVSSLLSAEIKYPNATYFAQDDSNIYFVDSNGVSSVAKSGGTPKVIIKSSDLPTNIGGLGVYYGNIYVLDKSGKQIDKFVATSGGFANTNYFASGVSPDLSNADSIAIDGSIWILFSDGTIEKFTRGTEDNFTITGLTKGFSNPTRIATDSTFSNIYILDKGNSRIVVLDKSGNYKAQYQADILKNATDFEVLESSNKVYVLSGGKVYQIDLK